MTLDHRPKGKKGISKILKRINHQLTNYPNPDLREDNAQEAKI
jgi:hypothetical protein